MIVESITSISLATTVVLTVLVFFVIVFVVQLLSIATNVVKMIVFFID